jgi:hypothetical protein
VSSTDDGTTQSTATNDSQPLNANEYQLLQRLLADPFSFPTEFKTWLVSYIEASDLDLPMSSVHGLNAALNTAGSTTTLSDRLSELETRITALEARP